ncbi:MAG: LytTR family DNA-binding domain-containing protein [Myxococcota bacterium]
MTLRAIVVDDEPPARDELSFLLGQCEGVEVVGQTGAPNEAERLCESVDPHVAFIDVRMPGTDAFHLANSLRRRHLDLDVVLVSSHDQDAIRGFEVQVADYILKPVSLDRLRKTVRVLSDARPDLGKAMPFERFAVRRRSAYVVVHVRDVVYFEARDELVWAVTATDRFAIDRTLASLAELLDAREFFQSHRRCIVRLDRIRLIEPCGARAYRIELEHPDAPTVPLARDRVGKLRNRIPFLR